MSDHGIYINRRTSAFYHVKAGDTITIYDSAMTPYDVKVAGVYQYYFGMDLFMTGAAYEEAFGTQPETNCFLIKNCPDASSIYEKLTEINGFENLNNTAETRSTYQNLSSALIIITLVLILAAGVMAYFILLNLANMYINQKKRELTIMRINGFTTRETILYVAREAVITTALGIILGIALGTGVAYTILGFLEQRQAGFVLTPSPSAWLFSALITALYSFVIYSIALKKVRYLKLTDIN